MSQDNVSNEERAAFPIKSKDKGHDIHSFGLDKMEFAGIMACSPYTNDGVLDMILEEAARRNIAAQVMCSFIANSGLTFEKEDLVERSIEYTDHLLNRLKDIEPLAMSRIPITPNKNTD